MNQPPSAKNTQVRVVSNCRHLSPAPPVLPLSGAAPTWTHSRTTQEDPSKARRTLQNGCGAGPSGRREAGGVRRAPAAPPAGRAAAIARRGARASGRRHGREEGWPGRGMRRGRSAGGRWGRATRSGPPAPPARPGAGDGEGEGDGDGDEIHLGRLSQWPIMWLID